MTKYYYILPILLITIWGLSIFMLFHRNESYVGRGYSGYSNPSFSCDKICVVGKFAYIKSDDGKKITVVDISNSSQKEIVIVMLKK